jgi:hypothetical protein
VGGGGRSKKKGLHSTYNFINAIFKIKTHRRSLSPIFTASKTAYYLEPVSKHEHVLTGRGKTLLEAANLARQGLPKLEVLEQLYLYTLSE